MASMLSATEICNLALDLLEEAPIDSIDDDRSTARWFKRNFWPTAWTLLRKHPWNFAMDRRSLAADPVKPAFGWERSFTVPAEWLRVLPLTCNGLESGASVPFKLEAGRILTNAGAPLKARGILRVDNTGLFDNMFCDALAANLAMKAAHFITGKQSYAERMGTIFQGALYDAQVADALEGTPDAAEDSFWVQSRN